MRKIQVVACATMVLLAACTPAPQGPTVPVMPAPNKPFQVFQEDQAICQNYAQQVIGPAQQQLQNQQVGSALIGTVLGAGIGAADAPCHRNLNCMIRKQRKQATAMWVRMLCIWKCSLLASIEMMIWLSSINRRQRIPMCRKFCPKVAPCSVRRPSECGMDIPTMNRNAGAMRSQKCVPTHGTCSNCSPRL